MAAPRLRCVEHFVARRPFMGCSANGARARVGICRHRRRARTRPRQNFVVDLGHYSRASCATTLSALCKCSLLWPCEVVVDGEFSGHEVTLADPRARRRGFGVLRRSTCRRRVAHDVRAPPCVANEGHDACPHEVLNEPQRITALGLAGGRPRARQGGRRPGARTAWRSRFAAIRWSV